MKGLITLTVTMLTLWSSGSRADMPATHGMLLFGMQKTYASHLPMFHAPHDYQVILELALAPSAHSIALKKYSELKITSTEIFTLVPVKMDLSKVIDGSLKNFTAEIVHGHFEKGGTDLGPVTVNVIKVIFSSKLDASLPVPQLNSYVVFGSFPEYFGAHLIQGKPNHDAIVTVSHPYKLEGGICKGRACLPPETVYIPDEKLPLTMDAPEGLPGIGASLGDFLHGNSEIQKLIYVEQDELAH